MGNYFQNLRLVGISYSSSFYDIEIILSSEWAMRDDPSYWNAKSLNSKTVKSVTDYVEGVTYDSLDIVYV